MAEENPVNNNVHELTGIRKIQQNGNGGNGGVIDYRLRELERRVERLENKIDEMNDLLIEINTKMNEKASKSWILYTVLGTIGVAILSVFIHIGIRLL